MLGLDPAISGLPLPPVNTLDTARPARTARTARARTARQPRPPRSARPPRPAPGPAIPTSPASHASPASTVKPGQPARLVRQVRPASSAKPGQSTLPARQPGQGRSAYIKLQSGARMAGSATCPQPPADCWALQTSTLAASNRVQTSLHFASAQLIFNSVFSQAASLALLREPNILAMNSGNAG